MQSKRMFERENLGTQSTVLLTFKTPHSEYDAVIVCDINSDPVFREVAIDFKDARNKTIVDIFGYDPSWELKQTQRILFRDVIENAAVPPSQWAVFARIEKGTPAAQRHDVCKRLSAAIRKYRGEERRHFYIKNMANNWLEKVCKDYNYPERDQASGKFNITKYGKRKLRSEDEPFPQTGSESETPARPSVRGVTQKSPLKKSSGKKTPGKRRSAVTDAAQGCDEILTLSEQSVAAPVESTSTSVAASQPARILQIPQTRKSPRKPVTQLTGLPQNLEILTSTRTEEDLSHRSPFVSPIPPADSEYVKIMRQIAGDISNKIDTVHDNIIAKQRRALTEFITESLPEVINHAIETKLVELMTPMQNEIKANTKFCTDNEPRIMTLLRLANENKKSNVALSKGLNQVTDYQANYDKRLTAIAGAAADTRSECTDLVAKVLPFKFVDQAFDILMSAEIFRKYVGYFIQPKLDSLAQDNIMNALASQVVTTLFTPMASAHLAFGENQNGISKMHMYRRALPKSFGDWVLTYCVQYVRRANNITASTKMENYAKCHGGMQIKFSNDWAKLIKAASENCPTSKDALDALWEMDMDYRDRVAYAIPQGVKTFTRQQYDVMTSKNRDLKNMISAEERGAKPANKQFPARDNVFDVCFKDAGVVLDDRTAYEFIAILATKAKLDPKKVRFIKSAFIPNIEATYLELLEHGLLDIDGGMKRLNVSMQAQPEVAPSVDDAVNDEAIEADAPEASTSAKKRKADNKKTPVKKARVSLSAKGLRKAAKEGRILQYQDKSSTKDSTADNEKGNAGGNEAEMSFEEDQVNEEELATLDDEEEETDESGSEWSEGSESSENDDDEPMEVEVPMAAEEAGRVDKSQQAAQQELPQPEIVAQIDSSGNSENAQASSGTQHVVLVDVHHAPEEVIYEGNVQVITQEELLSQQSDGEQSVPEPSRIQPSQPDEAQSSGTSTPPEPANKSADKPDEPSLD